MFARQWWVWYLGDIQQQSDQEPLSKRAGRTPNSHQIVTQSCCHPFIAFWLLAWFFFFFFYKIFFGLLPLCWDRNLSESFHQEEIWDARTPLPPWRHPALYFSDRERSTEVAVCISSISVRQQYNRAEERHVNRESKWLKQKKRSKRKGGSCCYSYGFVEKWTRDLVTFTILIQMWK